MNLTNKYDLPQQYVEFVTKVMDFAPPEVGVYRATQLLKGYKEMLLWRRHFNEIEADVGEFVWAVFGTAVHMIFEDSRESDSELKEERLKYSLDIDGTLYTVTGKFDLYCADNKLITDWKTASVWKIIYKDYEDWIIQQRIYKFLIESVGFPVIRGKVIALLKDHSKTDAKRKFDYPQLPFAIVNFDLDDSVDMRLWLTGKFNNIKRYELLPDNSIPCCEPKERWATEDKWAVMKKGRKSALRLLDSLDEAEKYLKEKGGDYTEERPGIDRKCIDYCQVNKFCDYYLNKYKGGW